MCKHIITLKRRLIVKLIQIQNDSLHLYTIQYVYNTYVYNTIQCIYNTEEKFCIFEILYVGLFIQCDNITVAALLTIYTLSTFP